MHGCAVMILDFSERAGGRACRWRARSPAENVHTDREVTGALHRATLKIQPGFAQCSSFICGGEVAEVCIDAP